MIGKSEKHQLRTKFDDTKFKFGITKDAQNFTLNK